MNEAEKSQLIIIKDEMFHKVKTVEPLPNYCLSVCFEDGTHKTYDVKPLFSKWETFKALLNIAGLFEQVKVDVGGYGIIYRLIL